MTTLPEKIAEEKKGNYQSSLKGGGVPPIGKRPIYFRFFRLKASPTVVVNVVVVALIIVADPIISSCCQ